MNVISKLIHVIKAKWLLEDNGTMFIQQDNAPPHMMSMMKTF